MSESTFYVRIRGKVSGPYEIEGLRRLVRQGMLSRIHEVSADRVSWGRAGEYDDLFPQRTAQSAVAVQDSAAEVTRGDGQGSAAPAMAAHAQYFYSQNGAAVGPVSMTVLHSLAQNGTVRATDMVWRENAEAGVPAYQVPALAAFFSSLQRGFTSTPQGTQVLSHREQQARQQAARKASFAVTGVCVLCAAVLFLFLLIPWAVVDGRAIWCWDFYRVPGMGAWAAAASYLLLSGVLLCIATPLTSGTARGILNTVISALGLVFLITALLSTDVSGTSVIQIIVPVALAGLLAVCMFRSVVPDANAGRGLLCIFSCAVTVGLLTSVILWMSEPAPLAGVPGNIIFGIVLAMAGLLAGLAAGVLGFVGLKPTFTPELNRATSATAWAGLVLPVIGGCIAVLGAAGFLIDLLPHGTRGELANAASARFAFSEIVLRIVFVWCAILALFASGVYELLLSVHVTTNLKQAR